MTRSGLPHSEIVGSEAASALPTLIAGNRVLHRLLVPRHPPYALSNLTKNLCWYTDTSSLITRQRCIIRISDRKTWKLYLGYAFGIIVHAFAHQVILVTRQLLVVTRIIHTSQLSKNNLNLNSEISISRFFCGAGRDRTGDLLVANQALSQTELQPRSWRPDTYHSVGLSGVEPLTSRLSGVRSNHLSYRPRVKLTREKK
jgi:hypothetical protein